MAPALQRRTILQIVLLAAALLATRLPMAPGQLVTFDDVNLAWSVGHFDIRLSQPQPPGYPLFVVQMRLLYWLRFRRAEHILFALATAGGLAALALLTAFGNRFFGRDAGFCAACMLLLHPVFWQTGVVSALRMQLAVISVAVAAACWQAWNAAPADPRRSRWVVWSAVVLAIGAGIRPEIGPLLFPLWAVSALRAPVSWSHRARALAAMAAVVLLWLVPTMIASGGPLAYIRTNLEYVSEQASVSSGLFGATEAKAHAALWRLIVWTGFGVLAWALPAVLAWRRREGWAPGRGRMAFLALWFLPPFLFALSVHVEDPGQVLAMVPAVSLFGGYLMARALDTLDLRISRWHALTLALATLLLAWIIWFHYGWFIVLWTPPATLAAALLLKLAQTKNAGNPPRLAMFAFLLAPVLVLNLTAFNFHGWYYQGTAGPLDTALADINNALSLTSREAVERTLDVDDHALRELRRLAAERPGQTVAVFAQGMTTWRKAAYYAPGLPVVVLEHKRIRTSPPTAAVWKGARQERLDHGPAPLHVDLPAASRIVWLLNPRTEIYGMVQRAFALTPAGNIWYTDLPPERGSRPVGEYELAW